MTRYYEIMKEVMAGPMFDTLGAKGQREYKDRLQQVEGYLKQARERLQFLNQKEEDMNEIGKGQDEVSLNNMRNEATGKRETREQYVQRMMLQKRASLARQRDQFGYNTPEYKRAEEIYQAFLNDEARQMSLFGAQYDTNRTQQIESQRIQDARMLSLVGI